MWTAIAPATMRWMPRQPPGDEQWCPVCDASPVVLVSLRHTMMRRWTEELLSTQHNCWEVAHMDEDELLVEAIARIRPDLVVVDGSEFPVCCQAARHRVPPEHVVVVGPEPDTAYRTAALANGAAGWVCRDDVADELSTAMRTALGCRHGPCPPAEPQTEQPDPHPRRALRER